MELILISESKLKIMLSRPDMEHYELETSILDCADAHTRAAFRHIFDDARAEIGFDTAGVPLFVQLYASPEGGCEIFVTKLEGTEAPPSVEMAACEGASLPIPADPGEKKLLERVRGCRSSLQPNTSAADSQLTAAYAFCSLEDLLVACRRLCTLRLSLVSHVYREESEAGTQWYLLIEQGSTPPPVFLAEYGRELSIRGLWDYVREHGMVVRTNDAIEVLGAL